MPPGTLKGLEFKRTGCTLETRTEVPKRIGDDVLPRRYLSCDPFALCSVARCCDRPRICNCSNIGRDVYVPKRGRMTLPTSSDEDRLLRGLQRAASSLSEHLDLRSALGVITASASEI